MHTMLKIFIGSALIVLSQLAAATSADLKQQEGEANCSHCHTSVSPITGAANLLDCSRMDGKEIPDYTAIQAPDVFILDQLSDIYEPVVFPHKLHASMTEMGQGCEVCHHNNPPDRIPPCRECHGGASNPVDLRQPGLKGAYHRQCLGCHRDWTHASKCEICHAKIDPNKPFTPPKDYTDMLGHLHPNIEVPDTRIYEIKELEKTPFVTFHHKDHTELFGLKCTDCHKRDNCMRCHDVGQHESRVRVDPHEDCKRCHQQDPMNPNCAFCHKAKIVDRFSHKASTGFALNGFHKILGCKACHKEPGMFSALDRTCTSCHAGEWPPETLDHAGIGVVFAEDHETFECEDCHGDGLGEALTCNACHEDDRSTFPDPEEGEKPEADTPPAADPKTE
jgi:hypothetical protein